MKNHCNLDLICLYNKCFVYAELDVLPQLLEVSLNNKSLVRPCLGEPETASLPHVLPRYQHPRRATTARCLSAGRSDFCHQPHLSGILAAGAFWSAGLHKHCSSSILRVLRQEMGGTAVAVTFHNAKFQSPGENERPHSSSV